MILYLDYLPGSNISIFLRFSSRELLNVLIAFNLKNSFFS